MFFCFFQFFQKMNEKFLPQWARAKIKNFKFVFFEELKTPKFPFKINWPLGTYLIKVKSDKFGRCFINFVAFSEYMTFILLTESINQLRKYQSWIITCFLTNQIVSEGIKCLNQGSISNSSHNLCVIQNSLFHFKFQTLFKAYS